MKLLKLFLGILSVIAVSSTGKAHAQSVTNWGEAVEGVQLSISSSNQVIMAGSSVAFQCLARNLTNGLITFAGDPNLDMEIALTDGAGKVYNLSRFQPAGFRSGSNPGFGLQFGETQKYNIPVVVAKDVPMGDYKLKAQIKLNIFTETNHNVTFRFPKVVSNSLDVKIKQLP